MRVVLEVDLEDLLRQLLQAGALVGTITDSGIAPAAVPLAGRVVSVEPIQEIVSDPLQPPAAGSSPTPWPPDRPLSPRMVAYLAKCSNNVVSDALQATSAHRLEGEHPMVDGAPSKKWRISLAAAEFWIALRAGRGHTTRRTVADLAHRFPSA